MRSLLVLLVALASGPDLRLLQGEYATRKFDELYASGSVVWMGIAGLGSTDLYVYDASSRDARRLRTPCEIDSVEALDGDGTRIYVGDRSGNLFRLTTDNTCDKVVQVGSRIRALAWDATRRTLWVAADDGLYTWSAAGLEDLKVTAFKPKALRVADGTLWLGTEQGLWRRGDAGFEKQRVSPELDAANINAVEVCAGQLWLGNHTHGLFRMPLTGGGPPAAVEFGAKQVASLFRQPAALLIGSESGLLRVNVADEPWDAKVRVDELNPRSPRPGERVQLTWEITNYDDRTLPRHVGQRIDVLDAAGGVVARHEVKPGLFDAVVPAPQLPGDYHLRFAATDLAGRETASTPRGASFAVQAGASPMPGWAVAGGSLLVLAGVLGAVRTIRSRAGRARDDPRPDTGAAVTLEPATSPPPNIPVGGTGDVVAGKASPQRQRRLKVFLCHSSNDKAHVRSIRSWLQREGADPWLDEEQILPGHDWEREITVAVRQSDAVLVCLSKGSVSKTGFVEREMRFALDVAEEQPEGTIFLIPVKLEECEPPMRLRNLHWGRLFDANGRERLLAALRRRADELGLPLTPAPATGVTHRDEPR